MYTNFLEVRVEYAEADPSFKSVCAGFESGSWRAKAFAKYLVRDCLLDFALTHNEKENISVESAGRQLAEAAAWLYSTPHYKSRGEIGELLLHVVMCQFYSGRSVVAKVHFKDAANDTVKGFDCVHLRGTGSDVELCLGEVKYYTNINSAVADVTEELKKHLAFDYLRAEFIPIRRKADASPEDKQLIERMTDKNISLDSIVKRICVPVLLTYDSTAVGAAESVCDEFIAAITDEVKPIYEKFVAKLPNIPFHVHLCLLPMGSKADLSKHFDEVLKACQTLN